MSDCSFVTSTSKGKLVFTTPEYICIIFFPFLSKLYCCYTKMRTDNYYRDIACINSMSTYFVLHSSACWKKKLYLRVVWTTCEKTHITHALSHCSVSFQTCEQVPCVLGGRYDEVEELVPEGVTEKGW